MRNYLGITGTPGTGKKTLAPLVASRLGVRCFSLTDLAESCGLVEPGESGAEVDARKLGRYILEKVRGSSLLFGHLFPYACRRADIARVVVLRCDPKVLKRRLRARGYPAERIIANVEAELIGVVSADSLTAFGPGKVVEFDTSRIKPDVAALRVSDLLGDPSTHSPPVEWVSSYDSPARLRSLLTVGRAASAFT